MIDAETLVHGFLNAASEAGFSAAVIFAPNGSPKIRLVGNVNAERIQAALAWYAKLNSKAASALAQTVHEHRGNPEFAACCLCGRSEPYDALEPEIRLAHELLAIAQIDAVKEVVGGSSVSGSGSEETIAKSFILA